MTGQGLSFWNPRDKPEVKDHPTGLIIAAWLESNGVCLQCANIRPSGATSCPLCGTGLFFEDVRRCSNCEGMVYMYEKKCQKCGTALSELPTADWRWWAEQVHSRRTGEVVSTMDSLFEMAQGYTAQKRRADFAKYPSTPVEETCILRTVNSGFLQQKWIAKMQDTGQVIAASGNFRGEKGESERMYELMAEMKEDGWVLERHIGYPVLKRTVRR